MNEKFTLKDLSKLIKICKNNNVSHVKYGEIELKLNIDATENPSIPNASQASESDKKAKENEEKGALQEQYNHAQSSLDSLQLEDPLEYERQLMDRELIENKKH